MNHPVNNTEESAPMFLRASGITKKYKEHRAVDNVTLEIDQGEVVSIIGPSGAGKSTFLRCINFLEMPTEGTVSIGKESVAVRTDSRLPSRAELAAIRRSVGMVFQSFNLFPHLTALRNISLAQERVLGRSGEEADEKSYQLLKRVGLDKKATAYPGQCSGGQQQRIAIARALALDPLVMLFDEPTSALDPEVGAEVLAVMRELADEGMTAIVVTHEMSFARDVSDRMVVMVDGSVVEEGDPHAIMSAPSHERTRQFLSAVVGR
ncbi:amino acid ABC transporter ATP-binding protein [Pseudarthrobacter sp. AL07]|uniref:amino acid ABC transporter ATP-binding protein n=1 Tax=unclassified Pseudarthrobacter TaxID=2647000 RepID=UPI00249BB166|nr:MULTISPECIES: amino acid ABC transporter ATP-binding protein [unclassified Pseudarthrobacter]MDI3193173.1 amino acid ABC transporter ATP-binding protein [Pseudarthrobacter sp. AL20]MDI3207007.1 amino acid ABC transporter ATP-binding protein [Pseudarthrobacter sp. AL07]